MYKEITTENLKIFKDILCSYNRIIIQMHNMPDSDTCSSAIAMEYIVSKIHPTAKVDIVYQNSMNLSLDIANMLESSGVSALNIKTNELDLFFKRYRIDPENDLLIYVDCQKSGGNVFPLNFKHYIAFDHHTDLKCDNYIYKDIQPLGSCSILIYKYIKGFNLNIDNTIIKDIIYYGLMIDLDDFTKEMDFETNTLRKSLEVLSLDRLFISTLHSVKFPKESLRDLSNIISNSIVDGKLFFSVLFDSDDNLIGTLADLILKFKDIDIVVICNEREETIKFSVRSKIPSVEAINITNIFTDNGGQKIVGGLTIGGCTVEKRTISSVYAGPIKLAVYNSVCEYVRRKS